MYEGRRVRFEMIVHGMRFRKQEFSTSSLDEWRPTDPTSTTIAADYKLRPDLGGVGAQHRGRTGRKRWWARSSSAGRSRSSARPIQNIQDPARFCRDGVPRGRGPGVVLRRQARLRTDVGLADGLFGERGQGYEQSPVHGPPSLGTCMSPRTNIEEDRHGPRAATSWSEFRAMFPRRALTSTRRPRILYIAMNLLQAEWWKRARQHRA